MAHLTYFFYGSHTKCPNPEARNVSNPKINPSIEKSINFVGFFYINIKSPVPNKRDIATRAAYLKSRNSHIRNMIKRG